MAKMTWKAIKVDWQWHISTGHISLSISGLS